MKRARALTPLFFVLAGVFILFFSRTSVLSSRHLASVSSEEIASLEDFIKLIKSEHLDTLDLAVAKLPTSMRSNFTLMYSSQSLQPASVSEPRAIVSTPDGKFSCAYSSGDTLECYQFRNEESRFDFHEIQFYGQRKPPILSKLNRGVDEKITCTRCHGNDPRPNWEIYPHWKGAFGSHDDLIDAHASHDYSEQNPSTIDQIRLGEAEDFKVFLENKAPRYQSLLFDRNSKSGPYLITGKGTPDLRPNLRLTYEIVRLVALRDARIIWNELPKSSRYEFLLAKANCASLLEYADSKKPFFAYHTVPELLSPYLSPGEWTPFFRFLDPACLDCGVSTSLRGGEDIPRADGTGEPLVLPAGSHPSTFDFNTGGGYDGSDLNDFVAEQLLVRLVNSDAPELKEIWSEKRRYLFNLFKNYGWITERDYSILENLAEPWDFENYSDSERSEHACKILAATYQKALTSRPKTFKKKSKRTPDHQIAAAASLASPVKLLTESARPEMIRTCLSCHQAGVGIAPPIDFDHPENLSRWLIKIDDRTRDFARPMPPYGLMGTKAQVEFMNYLNSAGHRSSSP